jgi:hypothetical protein
MAGGAGADAAAVALLASVIAEALMHRIAETKASAWEALETRSPNRYWFIVRVTSAYRTTGRDGLSLYRRSGPPSRLAYFHLRPSVVASEGTQVVSMRSTAVVWTFSPAYSTPVNVLLVRMRS